jgi:hypothetical protein
MELILSLIAGAVGGGAVMLALGMIRKILFR